MVDRDFLKTRAIEHYNRMIAWIDSLPEEEKKEYPRYRKMYYALGETWGSEDCVYCKKYLNRKDAGRCPLYAGREEICNCMYAYDCCEGLWEYMAHSKNWVQFALRARKLRAFIHRCG